MCPCICLYVHVCVNEKNKRAIRSLGTGLTSGHEPFNMDVREKMGCLIFYYSLVSVCVCVYVCVHTMYGVCMFAHTQLYSSMWVLCAMAFVSKSEYNLMSWPLMFCLV